MKKDNDSLENLPDIPYLLFGYSPMNSKDNIFLKSDLLFNARSYFADWYVAHYKDLKEKASMCYQRMVEILSIDYYGVYHNDFMNRINHELQKIQMIPNNPFDVNEQVYFNNLMKRKWT